MVFDGSFPSLEIRLSAFVIGSLGGATIGCERLVDRLRLCLSLGFFRSTTSRPVDSLERSRPRLVVSRFEFSPFKERRRSERLFRFMGDVMTCKSDFRGCLSVAFSLPTSSRPLDSLVRSRPRLIISPFEFSLFKERRRSTGPFRFLVDVGDVVTCKSDFRCSLTLPLDCVPFFPFDETKFAGSFLLPELELVVLQVVRERFCAVFFGASTIIIGPGSGRTRLPELRESVISVGKEGADPADGLFGGMRALLDRLMDGDFCDFTLTCFDHLSIDTAFPREFIAGGGTGITDALVATG